jgi:hypothetical protein
MSKTIEQTRSTLEEKPETERVAKVRVDFKVKEVNDRFTRREASRGRPGLLRGARAFLDFEK